MIEHELLLLGLLKDGPKHGYEIKIQVQEILSLFAGVELKSIYYPLRVLEKKGFVTKRVRKPGKHPERFVYSLTPGGARRFSKLLSDSFLNFKRPQFSLDLSLYFMRYLKPAVSRRRLRGRQRILERLIKGLKEMMKSQNKKTSLNLAH
ncbi:MAG: PadR family transcriptional regulator, partial [Candidatus Omnitrophica bacterium]|nr:PadR family transcriptional regulator [Candidatus Omnitrophota bacterium]